ncbi:exodeoxyribonuclease V subunit alpha [Undibacterium sp. WLHG33]|uniref:exodeoxyribonuclease V subunit alpha n=1 Tax=Undibacterium sp. WLHG33 TaxID=3412482 RepID=UPI003C2E6A43
MMVATPPVLERFKQYAEQGQVRLLSVAFMRFMHSLGMQDQRQLLIVGLLCELEALGHSCIKLGALVADPCALSGWDKALWETLVAEMDVPADVEGWLHVLSSSAQIYAADKAGQDDQFDQQEPLVLHRESLYLRRYWRHEMAIATAARRRASALMPVDVATVSRWLDVLFHASDEIDWQKTACAIAVRSHFSVITGGPGTGKTYTVARLLALLFALSEQPERLRIALAAPTGKAAARLKQAIDHALSELAQKIGPALPLAELTNRIGAARTLHSLLGARPDTRAFRHHAGNLLDIDVLIVDEASMVHLEMMAALLAALPESTMLILLGDKDQLASVEAGAVLGDLCDRAESGNYSSDTARYIASACGKELPAEFIANGNVIAQQTVMLRKSRRFSGAIGTLALAVNRGQTELAIDCLRRADEHVLYWAEAAQQKTLLQMALHGRAGAEGGYFSYLQVLAQRPQGDDEAQFQQWVIAVLKAFESFRILCAVREGDWGVSGLNQSIEKHLHQLGHINSRTEWYTGRPVMITRNDYGIGVFNGDIGMTLPDFRKDKVQRVYFLEGDKLRHVLTSRLRHVETAFAMTVHKSQGSEFQHTVMVLPAETSPVITRELIYTGITRAKEKFSLLTPVASVLGHAIGRLTLRASGLQAALNVD